MERKKESRTQWHKAFCEAMKLTLGDNYDDLYYDDENIITKGSLRTDLLIIRKDDDVIIKNRIGRIFRRHNIFEYKSPGDAMNIDTFYKVIAYGCLYKSQNGDHVDDIKADEVTLTMIREAKPEKMFKMLESVDIHVRRSFNGIYYLTGRLMLSTQVIVTSELPKDDYMWLKVLTRNLGQDDARDIVLDMDAMDQESWRRRSADSVMQVSVSANHKTFEDLKKEEPYMCDALRELMAPEIKEEVDAAVASAVASVKASAKAETDTAVDNAIKMTKVDMYSTKMHYTPDQISIEMNLSEDDVKKILSDIAKNKKKKK